MKDLTVDVPNALRNVVIGFTGVFSESVIHPDDAPNSGAGNDE